MADKQQKTEIKRRYRKLDYDTVRALIPVHKGNYAKMAEALGVTRHSVRPFIMKYPELLAEFNDEKERTIDGVEDTLIQAALGGESWAVCFYLKTQAKHRGYVEKLENLPPLQMLMELLDPDIRKVVENAIETHLQPGRPESVPEQPPDEQQPGPISE